ncbi:hypothetical protein D3C73_1595900 [compost metagenome]
MPGTGALHRRVALDDARLANGIEGVGLAAERAVPASQGVKHQEHSEQLPEALARRLVDELQRTHEQADATGQ